MSNPDTLIPKSRHQPLPFNKSSFRQILINRQGLVANNVADLEGRGNYFPGVAGATEGVLLLAKGVADAFMATADPGWEFLLDRLTSGLNYLYGNRPVAHWLYAVKAPFVGERLHYARQFYFTNGVAVIPQALGGGLSKNIYHVRSADSEYLWENPYSVLRAGQFYPIHYILRNADKTTTVALTNTGFNGPAYIMYSTLEGETIFKNQLFEAWPAWRRLESQETNIALDSIAWSLDAYNAIMLAKNDSATYQPKIDAIAASVLSLYDVNDGRAWITRRLVHPMQVSGSFQYAEVSGLVIEMDSDGSIIFALPVNPSPGGSVTEVGTPAWWDAQLGIAPPDDEPIGWNSEVQFGRAVSDTILAQDSIWISITASRALTVNFFIDTANVYGPETRYFYSTTLIEGHNSFFVAVNQFKNASAVSLAVGQAIFDVGWSVLQTHLDSVSPFELKVHDIRPLPHVALNYMPGICPFTANFVYGEPVSWRGPVYSGYQDPNIWDYVSGHADKANVILDFLLDAQTAYTAVFPAISGPFAPCYYLQRYDSVEYGPINTFGWNGPDPNTRWEGYQFRPLFETARYLYAHPGSSKALQIVSPFLTYLNSAFDPEFGFPSDFPGDSLPQHNYFSAHALFLVMGAAIYFEQAGHATYASHQILTKSAALAVRKFEHGIWAPNDADWFGFWNGVILSVLALVKRFELTLFSDAQLETFFTENQAWLNAHTEGF